MQAPDSALCLFFGARLALSVEFGAFQIVFLWTIQRDGAVARQCTARRTHFPKNCSKCTESCVAAVQPRHTLAFL